VLLSIVARIACATVLLAAGVLAVVARGPLDEIMDTSFVPVAVMGGPVQVARVCRRRMAGALWTSYDASFPDRWVEAMKRRSRAGGEPAKARRRKSVTLKRRNAPKVTRADGRCVSPRRATYPL